MDRRITINREMQDESISLFVRLLGIYYVSLIFGAMHIGPIGSLLKIIGFIPIVVWFFFRSTVYFSRLWTVFMLEVLWTAAANIWTINAAGSKERLFTQGAFLLLLVSVSAYIYNDREIYYLKRCLVWSSRISAVCTVAFASFHEGRMYLNGVLKEDPNYLCAYFLFGIVNGFQILMGDEDQERSKLFYGLEELFYFYVIFATGSRGGLLAVLAAVFVYCLFREKRWTISPQTVITCCAAGILLVVAVFVMFRFVPMEVLDRFSPSTLAHTDGTGRFTIWEDTLRVFRNSSLARQMGGYGPGTAFTLAEVFNYRVKNVVHNIFLEHLIELGVVGLALYCIYIFRFWICARIQKNDFAFAVMSGLIVLSLSTSIQTFKPYWNILIFIICSEYTTRSVSEKERE
ncbi:MAG: O-antigen ligase family protein [Lachnospiraceae bacterium]|nr:O-antigen ligase family protein [Lachnospiraceae bacterium]